MRRIRFFSKAALVSVLAGGWLFQLACARNFQQEVEVLFATAANPLLIRNSFLVNLFGPGLIKPFH